MAYGSSGPDERSNLKRCPLVNELAQMIRSRTESAISHAQPDLKPYGFGNVVLRVCGKRALMTQPSQRCSLSSAMLDRSFGRLEDGDENAAETMPGLAVETRNRDSRNQQQYGPSLMERLRRQVLRVRARLRPAPLPDPVGLLHRAFSGRGPAPREECPRPSHWYRRGTPWSAPGRSVFPAPSMVRPPKDGVQNSAPCRSFHSWSRSVV